jgi:hypothetical protein
VCLLLKPLYYDELAKESRGLSAPTTLEMGVVTFFCVYFVGFLFFYLVENPSVKCGDYLVARFKRSFLSGAAATADTPKQAVRNLMSINLI